jgi:hypothetical protein
VGGEGGRNRAIVVDPDSLGSLDQGPTKIENGSKFHFLSAGCSLLRAEGFSCSLDVLCQ